MRRRSSVVEQLFCKQLAGGSNPFVGSIITHVVLTYFWAVAGVDNRNWL